MSNTFFSSDHHFYHANIINYSARPFATVEEMNEKLVENWNKVVKPGDTMYYLGDFSLAHRAVTVFVPRLNGDIHLIAGNHDHVHPVHYKKDDKGERMRKVYYEAGIKSIKLEDKMHIGKHSVKLHHMPYTDDHTESERYTKWRPTNEGGWLLCGHIHEKWKLKDKQLNVGVDVWDYTPVAIEQIEEILNA